ncbi:MAG: DUF3160 domain-containing protein [Pseudomonadota bacterium]
MKVFKISVVLAVVAVCQLAAAQSAQVAAAPQVRSIVELYQDNRKRGLPNFVTPDLLVVAYADLSRRDLKIRESLIARALDEWVSSLTSVIADSTEDMPAVDLIQVLAALSGKSVKASSVAAEEIAKVDAAEGIAISPLLAVNVDYSQFRPRGFYAESDELARYFKTLRYCNSILFHAHPSAATGVTAEIVAHHMGILTDLLRLGGAENGYEALVEVATNQKTVEDISLSEVASMDLASPLAPQILEYAAINDRFPTVYSGYVDRTGLAEGETVAQVLLGARILPGTVTADVQAMQALVTDSGAWRGEGELPFTAAMSGSGVVKGWPSAAEVLAAMGADSAAQSAELSGDDDFEFYATLIEHARSYFNDLTEMEAARWGALTELADLDGDSEQNLASAKAFWTLVRYENLLYAKQGYTPVDRSLGSFLDRQGSTLMPASGFYRSLITLVENRGRGTVDEAMSTKWEEFGVLVGLLLQMSEALDSGTELTAEQEDTLADIDLTLKRLNIDADLPIVVDVHTHPGEAQVLEQATGWPEIVTINEARGARLTHWEFKQPIQERLTDTEWRDMLAEQSKENDRSSSSSVDKSLTEDESAVES